jgi:hypothetical protein
MQYISSSIVMQLLHYIYAVYNAAALYIAAAAAA